MTAQSKINSDIAIIDALAEGVGGESGDCGRACKLVSKKKF
jgi:hypothetical protein